MAKNQSLPARLQKKDYQGEHDLDHIGTSRRTHRLVTKAYPRSTNNIVWAFLHANPTLLRVVMNRVHT